MTEIERFQRALNWLDGFSDREPSEEVKQLIRKALQLAIDDSAEADRAAFSVHCKCGKEVMSLQPKFLHKFGERCTFSPSVKLVPDIEVKRGLLDTTQHVTNRMTYKDKP